MHPSLLLRTDACGRSAGEIAAARARALVVALILVWLASQEHLRALAALAEWYR